MSFKNYYIVLRLHSVGSYEPIGFSFNEASSILFGWLIVNANTENIVISSVLLVSKLRPSMIFRSRKVTCSGDVPREFDGRVKVV